MPRTLTAIALFGLCAIEAMGASTATRTYQLEAEGRFFNGLTGSWSLSMEFCLSTIPTDAGATALVTTEILGATFTYPGPGVDVVPLHLGTETGVEIARALSGSERIVPILSLAPVGGGGTTEYARFSFTLIDSTSTLVNEQGIIEPSDLTRFNVIRPSPFVGHLGGEFLTSSFRIDSFEVTPVPEPSAAVLVAGAAVLLAAARRRR